MLTPWPVVAATTPTMVDNAGDVVTEVVGEGSATVLASVNYTLVADREVETLRAKITTGRTLTGNESPDILVVMLAQ